jgi:hypothetical protein
MAVELYPVDFYGGMLKTTCRQLTSTISLAFFLLFLLLPETTAPALTRNEIKRVIVICTNDTCSYLDACGCGGRNAGGLVRRTTLIRNLKK